MEGGIGIVSLGPAAPVVVGGADGRWWAWWRGRGIHQGSFTPGSGIVVPCGLAGARRRGAGATGVAAPRATAPCDWSQLYQLSARRVSSSSVTLSSSRRAGGATGSASLASPQACCAGRRGWLSSSFPQIMKAVSLNARVTCVGWLGTGTSGRGGGGNGWLIGCDAPNAGSR